MTTAFRILKWTAAVVAFALAWRATDVLGNSRSRALKQLLEKGK